MQRSSQPEEVMLGAGTPRADGPAAVLFWFPAKLSRIKRVPE